MLKLASIFTGPIRPIRSPVNLLLILFFLISIPMSVSLAQSTPADQDQAVLTTTAPSFQYPEATGIGLTLGSPSGLNVKVWPGTDFAYSFGLAYWVVGDFYLTADYLQHFPQFLQKEGDPLNFFPYLGFGGGLYMGEGEHAPRDDQELALYVRVPLGLEWKGRTLPLGVFLELSPSLTLIPGVVAFFQGGMGVRYYF